MADDELAKIRAARLAEMQQQFGGQNAEKQRQEQEMKQREEDMKNSLLQQILDQSARARLNSIAMVKPEKAKMVESMLLQMAQTGQLPGKIDEHQLVSLLERINVQTQKKTTVKYNRRRLDDSDDSD